MVSKEYIIKVPLSIIFFPIFYPYGLIMPEKVYKKTVSAQLMVTIHSFLSLNRILHNYIFLI